MTNDNFVFPYKAKFLDAMNDDFNTPQVIAMLFDFSREVNSLLASGNISNEQLLQTDSLFSEVGGDVLGIIPKQIESKSTAAISENDLMNLVIDIRKEIREHKLWKLSDKIRDGLNELNIALEDGKDGTMWKRK